MPELENQDESEADGREVEGDSGGVEAEHTVIDTELGALIREAVEENSEERVEKPALGTGLTDLGPAFSDESSSVVDGPHESTRVLEAPGSAESSAIVMTNEAEPSSAGPARGEQGGVEDWGRPVHSSEDTSVTAAWAELDDQPSAWDALSGGSEGLLDSSGDHSNVSRGKTGVYHDFEPSGAGELGGRLICIEGVCSGSEFPILKGNNYIGRSVSNEILIEDPSISRIHALIVWKDGAFRVVDQESNNGIFLNSEKVSDALLSSGDQVCFGNLLFRFVEEGEVAEGGGTLEESVVEGGWAQRWRDFRDGGYFWSTLTSVAMFVATIAIVCVIVVSRSPSGSSSTQSDAVFQHFLAGIEAFKRHEWTESERQFSILLSLEPQHSRTQQYMAAIAIEKRAEEQLRLAQKSRAQGALQKAYRYATDVGESIYFSEAASEVIRKINLELETQVARARSSLEAGQLKEALALLAGVEEIRAGLAEVAALRDMALRALEETSSVAPSNGAVLPPKVIESKSLRRSEQRQLQKPQKAFAQGRITEAIALLEGERNNLDARMLAEKMMEFKDTYQAGVQAHRTKRAGPGIKLLSRALELEGQISYGQSLLVSQMKKKLADLYYLQGSQALGVEDWQKAFAAYSKSVGYVPDFSLASRGLAALADKAVDLYHEASELKDSDPNAAKAKWELVLKMVPPNNPYYVKTKSRLRNLR